MHEQLTPTRFTNEQVEALHGALNHMGATTQLLLDCAHITAAGSVLSIGMQQGVAAIVTHLLPSGQFDVTVAGIPTQEAFQRLEEVHARLQVVLETTHGWRGRRGLLTAALGQAAAQAAASASAL